MGYKCEVPGEVSETCASISLKVHRAAFVIFLIIIYLHLISLYTMLFHSRFVLAIAGMTIFAQVEALPKYFRAHDTQPNLAHDPNTTRFCSWWIDYTGAETCAQLLSNNFVSEADFRRWNPSVGANCAGLKSGNSYCVETNGEPAPSLFSTSLMITATPITYPPVTPTLVFPYLNLD